MTKELCAMAKDIFEQTLAAIEVEAIVSRAISIDGSVLNINGEVHDLNRFSQLIVIAIGKASVPMARSAGNILGSRINHGLIATNSLSGASPNNFQIFIGGHPLPNRSSLDAATTALNLLRAANDEKTLVLFLISGGGSALFEKPVDASISLEDLQEVNRILVGCGAVIGEINIVRRFLSAVKGGRLAEAASQARQISLYISDVNDDDLSTVSSGLTLPGNITRSEFDRIVTKYDLLKKFPASVSTLISSGKLPDLPSTNNSSSRTHHLLLDNRGALQVARKIAERQYQCVVEVAADLVEGDVEEMARIHLARVQRLREKYADRPVCLLSGGEVICPVRGTGEGGRNQEFVLRAALHLDSNSQIAILSAGTDGIDGQSPAAGAYADETTISQARERQLSPSEYLQRSDSYNFFKALDSAIITGPTGNNVRDLRIVLAN